MATTLHVSLSRPAPRRLSSDGEFVLATSSETNALSTLRSSASTPPSFAMPCRIQLADDDILRTCTVEDVDGLEELEKACKMPSETLFGRKAWLDRLSADAPFVCGVYRRGRIMAFIAGTLHEGRPDTLFITEVVMRSQWRRQTSSHRILGAYMDMMSEKGIRVFMIQSREHLKPLYESLGFKCVGQVERDGDSWVELRQSKPSANHSEPIIRLRSSTDPTRVLTL